MSVYKIAPGHDNADGFVTLNPQPASPGLLYAERRFAANGAVYDHGAAHTLWIYDGILTPAQYSAVLTDCGLISVVSALVTIYTLTDAARATWTTYNARIVRPFNGADARFKRGFWRDVTFILRELEVVT